MYILNIKKTQHIPYWGSYCVFYFSWVLTFTLCFKSTREVQKNGWSKICPFLSRLLEILEGWIISIPTIASSDSNHPSWSHQRCLPLKRKAVEGNTYLFWITSLATLLFRNHATFCATLQAAADFSKQNSSKKLRNCQINCATGYI